MSLVGYTLVAKRIEELRQTVAPKHPIYGIYWDKSSDPTLTRIDDAVGKEAAVGVDGEYVVNDFDRLDIFGEIGEVTDELGNVFVRIPKFYIQKRSGPGFHILRISKTQYPGFYLPWCFWDFERERELPYVDVGKHLASLGTGNRLESKPGKMPLTSVTIGAMRNYARNNNVDGLRGYQQLDIHVYDVIRTLMTIEFATLNMQSIMFGFAAGRYSASDVITVGETNTNRAIVSNSTASGYEVGQSIAIGTVHSNNSVSGTAREILAIEPYDDQNTAIVFDGDPIDTEVGHVIANRAYRTGWSSRIAASSGGIVNLSNGRYPCMYRGIESPYGDIYQFVDGVNINDHQAWVARDPKDYASNLFAAPYEPLGYVNSNTNGYPVEMGFDPAHPYAEFPVKMGGSSSTYYSDYYNQNILQRVAHTGGYWYRGADVGPWLWFLNTGASYSDVTVGGRLVKKPL